MSHQSAPDAGEKPQASTFPVCLLSESTEARYAHFRNYTIVHPFLKQACKEFLQCLRDPADICLVLLVGPTGVGKSTVKRQVLKEFLERHRAQPEADFGHVPAIAVEAPAPESGNFNWKQYYKIGLRSLADPFLAYKLEHTAYKQPVPFMPYLRAKGVPSSADLREEFEETVRCRNLSALLVDEAQHFLKMASGRKSTDQMDALKSMASLSQTVHGLLGTYELLAFANLSGQISRRSVEIHFRRYRSESKEECEFFIQTLMGLGLQMPLVQTPLLEIHWEYCYTRSIGCIGVLKDWMCRAYAVALSENAKTVTREHMERTALSIAKCLKMVGEALEGETAFQGGAQDEQLLHARLWSGITERPGKEENTKRRKYAPPGTRNPTRDAVGEAGGTGGGG